MSTQVTPSAPGSQLPQDSGRGRPFQPPHRPPPEEDLAERADRVEISPSGYASRPGAASGEVAQAISFTQTQHDFLDCVAKALDRMGELTVLCQDTSRSNEERVHYTVEFTQLQDFISEIGAKKFNGMNLFSGKPITVPLNEPDLQLPIEPVNLTAGEPEGGIADACNYGSADVNTHASAARALTRIRKAAENLSEMQRKVNSNLQRLNLTTEQMAVLSQNLSSANHRINDMDLARSIAETARSRMLRQASAALSAQANAAPDAAIRLLE